MNESRFGNRIAFLHDIDVMEVDFSDLTFDNSRMVDEFYDEIERQIRATGQDWFFLVNYRNCRIFELAWIRFAQRGKRLNLAHSRGSVRFATRPELGETIEQNAKRENFDPNLFESRDAALAKIEQMRLAARD